MLPISVVKKDVTITSESARSKTMSEVFHVLSRPWWQSGVCFWLSMQRFRSQELTCTTSCWAPLLFSPQESPGDSIPTFLCAGTNRSVWTQGWTGNTETCSRGMTKKKSSQTLRWSGECVKFISKIWGLAIANYDVWHHPLSMIYMTYTRATLFCLLSSIQLKHEYNLPGGKANSLKGKGHAKWKRWIYRSGYFRFVATWPWHEDMKFDIWIHLTPLCMPIENKQDCNLFG